MADAASIAQMIRADERRRGEDKAERRRRREERRAERAERAERAAEHEDGERAAKHEDGERAAEHETAETSCAEPPLSIVAPPSSPLPRDGAPARAEEEPSAAAPPPLLFVDVHEKRRREVFPLAERLALSIRERVPPSSSGESPWFACSQRRSKDGFHSLFCLLPPASEGADAKYFRLKFRIGDPLPDLSEIAVRRVDPSVSAEQFKKVQLMEGAYFALQ